VVMGTSQNIVPTLQVVNGTDSGRLYQLDREVTVIGRNADCDIVLMPKSVSRKHAAIMRRNGGFVLKDLGSTRGTFVNGQRLTQPSVLEDANTIQVGEIVLTFNSQLVQIQDSANDQSTVYAAIDLLQQSDRNLPLVKPETKLRALRLISQELGSTLVLSEILERIFNSLFEIFPRAERGFVLLRDTNSQNLVPEVIRSRSGPAGELRISKTILNRVLEEGQAILSKDLAKEFPDSESVSDTQIRSLLCAPILDQKQKPVGIIQIDTRDGRGRFEQEDLDVLAAVASQISVAVQNAQLHRALLRQSEMEQELQFARQVMQALLPEKPVATPGYDFWAYYEPARHVGGDYYGFIPIERVVPEGEAPTRRWAIAVGDVVGKGMPAALMTARFSAEVRLFLQGDPDPVHVVERLNSQFDAGSVLDLYITFLLVMLDVTEHRLTVVNAGHPCPIIRRADGRLDEVGRDISGLPLAIMPDYRYESIQTNLEPGDVVILYTDGVTDAMNAAGNRLTEVGLREAINTAGRGASAVGDSVVKSIQKFVAERAQFDDISLVCFSRD
jgi:sigma-B regulation protein RsbU (phosphoserine phosphatase)